VAGAGNGGLTHDWGLGTSVASVMNVDRFFRDKDLEALTRKT
jgi:hypothetical protein